MLTVLEMPSKLKMQKAKLNAALGFVSFARQVFFFLSFDSFLRRMQVRSFFMNEVLFSWFFLVMKTNPVLPARYFLTAPNSNSKVVSSSFVGLTGFLENDQRMD